MHASVGNRDDDVGKVVPSCGHAALCKRERQRGERRGGKCEGRRPNGDRVPWGGPRFCAQSRDISLIYFDIISPVTTSDLGEISSHY